MQYLLTPYSEFLEPFAYWENGLNENELDWLQKEAMNSFQEAKIGQNEQPIEEQKKHRRSQITWLDCNENTKWVFEKLSHIVSSLNSQFYRFDLTGFGEALQLTNYKSSENGTYGWHMDCGGKRNISRKLSVVLQLTDPSQYEGGNLEISVGASSLIVPKRRGLIVVFPSFHLHQVTPVTQGSRQSLVSWISGPPFK